MPGRGRPHSLVGRLLPRLIAVQVGLVVAALLVFPLVSPYVSYADIADLTVRQLVEASIRRGADGQLVIKPTAALKHYEVWRRHLAYAAMERATRRVVPGSTPELAEVLRKLGPLLPRDSDSLETDRPGGVHDSLLVTGQSTRFGSMVMATAGNAFGWLDLVALSGSFFPAMLPIFLPLLFGSAMVVLIVVRRSTRPLRQAADLAAHINMRSLEQRLPQDGMPAELVPLLAAVNNALERLQGQVERQRLFIANASHELRTPVTILQARIDGLSEPQSRTELQRDVGRVRVLVEQLLSIARLEKADIRPDTELDLVGQVRSLVASCAPLAIRSGRSIEFVAENDRAVVRGDARAIEGAVTNVIDNALRAEPVGGRVIVTVRTGAVIEVADHGPGIPPEDRERIFEPFWRRQDGQPGIGLGLAIVREVVTLHGGEVLADETPGGGATLRLSIPQAGHAERKQTMLA